MGLEAEKEYYHEIEYLLPKLVIKILESILASRKQSLICCSCIETASTGVAGLWYSVSSFFLAAETRLCVQC